MATTRLQEADLPATAANNHAEKVYLNEAYSIHLENYLGNKMMATSVDLAFWAILLVAIYKAISLFIGLVFGYLGYRLFLTGIERSAGVIEASSGSHLIKMSRAAPGTFFALFGAIIITVTLFQGFDVDLPDTAQQLLNKLPEHPPMMQGDQ